MAVMTNIAEAWKDYLGHMTTGPIHPREAEIVQMAFYAGCAAMLNSLNAALNENDGGTFVREAMEEFRAQINDFSVELLRRLPVSTRQ